MIEDNYRQSVTSANTPSLWLIILLDGLEHQSHGPTNSHTYGNMNPFQTPHLSIHWNYPYYSSSYGSTQLCPTNPINTSTEDKDIKYNKISPLKRILDYYNKHDYFYGSMDEDYYLHFSQFNSFCDKYQTDADTRQIGHPPKLTQALLLFLLE